jgi:cyclic pyranopterin phosphate synthase
MKLNHFDENGQAVMVDVSDKDITSRTAIAAGKISMNKEAYEAAANGTAKKGDVIGTARIAGIMASKRTSDIIPLCHPLMLTKCSVDFKFNDDEQSIEATALVKTDGKTGVEMEALTAVSAALLTIYDMLKAVDRGMKIGDISVRYKAGGKSGEFGSGLYQN